MNEILEHTHNGINSQRLYPKDFYGFPIYDAIPTHKAEEGTQIYVIAGGIKYLYVMLNRVWTRMATASSLLTNTATLNFGAIGPSTSADLTMALTGALVGDTVVLGVDDGVISGGVNCTNIVFFAWVSAPNVITIRCLNNDAALTANPASGVFRATVIQL